MRTTSLKFSVRECVLYVLGFYPELLFWVRYYINTKKLLNLKNPKTLYDKIAYMMFRTDTSIWSELADKVKVREYIKEKGFGSNVAKIYGIWKKADDIVFDILPNQFVIKTNNASATNIIVTDKRLLDINKTRSQLNSWLQKDYGHYTGQPHYSKIEPLILAEEFLVDNETTKKGRLLIDYKFYCVNGEPLYVQVIYDRIPNTHDFKLQVFDMDWNAHPEFISEFHEHSNTDLKKPQSFDEMKVFVRSLSKDLKFVRVDLYEINGTPMFGELTFTPGLDSFTPDFMHVLGNKFSIKSNN